MFNPVKNVIRSFKNNKISIIGLIFLIFFGLGVFCIISNTTTNITNQYTSISNQGNLHNITANELYNIGNPAYHINTKGVIATRSVITTNYEAKDEDDFLKDGKHVLVNELCTGGTGADGTYYFAVPKQIKSGTSETDYVTYIRTYHISLDADASTGLYSRFAKSGSYLVNFDIQITQSFAKGEEIPEYVTNLEKAQKPVAEWDDGLAEQIAKDNVYLKDYNEFTKKLNDQTTLIFNAMTTSDTPLANFLSKNYKNELDYRFFKSINVTATKDNIFYKVIDSNPNECIDNMVLFEDQNGRTGFNLYSTNNANNYNSEVVIYNKDNKIIDPGTKIGPFVIPEKFEDVALIPLVNIEQTSHWDDATKLVYSQLMRIRFKRMHSGNNTKESLIDVNNGLLVKLSAIDLSLNDYNTQFYTAGSDIANAYDDYYNSWYINNAETVSISANGSVVFAWVELLGTPQTCTVSNWTSNLAIVNPQHLKAVGKSVLDPQYIINFAPFKYWYKSKYGQDYNLNSIDSNLAKEWFNTLNTKEFNFWLNPLRALKSEETSISYYSHIKGATPIEISKNDWKGIPNQHIVDCGGYFEIIWGCGLTPDFIYPVVDISRPTPNFNTECLVYCNDAGYKSIKLAFVNSNVEEYLIAKFKANTNTARQQQIVNEINQWAGTDEAGMILPQGISCVYFANDTSNVLNCSALRVSFIPSLVNTINIITIILCTLIGIICFIICLIIIKRYVENNRVSIGIMRANGISKTRIAASLFPFALFPSVIGGIAAYLVGFFLQAPMLGLFSNYWTLPTPLLSFDWLSFILCIFLPFILFCLVCFIATFVVLRINTVELMKAGSEFKATTFSRAVKKPFKFFGIMTRFRVSLAFNSLWRLIILALATCLTMSSLVFAFTTMNKLNASQTTNSSQFKYDFSIKLTTPTTSGSTFSLQDQSIPTDDNNVWGMGRSDSNQYIYNNAWDLTDEDSKGKPWYNSQSHAYLTKYYAANQISTIESGIIIIADGYPYRDILSKQGNLMLPNAADSKGQNVDLFYLDRKTCTKLTLDYNMGAGTMGSSNPWEIAVALMPANSRNMAADAYQKIINKVARYVWDAQKGSKWFFSSEDKPDTNIFKKYFDYSKDYPNEGSTVALKTSMEDVGWPGPILPGILDVGMAFNEGFVRLLKTIYTDKDLVKDEYAISYGVVPINYDYNEDVNKKDETYTYVNGQLLNSTTRQAINEGHEITIEGIQENSHYINLTDSKGNNLNQLLYKEDNNNDQVKPIVINAYAAHKYRLGVGNTLTIRATNTADRYERTIHPDDYHHDKSNELTFRVVGISVGTTNEAFYSTQKVCNNLLGLPNGVTWNKTHRYMTWADPTTEWGRGTNEPKLIDLAGVGATANNKAVIYNSSYKFTEEIQKFNTNVPTGFNGIYTSNKSGKPITNQLSLYSYTGMYPSTSIYKSQSSNNKMTEILMQNNNLPLANIVTGIKNQKYFDAYAKLIASGESEAALAEYRGVVNEFIDDLVKYYGDTTMITAMNGGMDIAASDLVYTNLINTFNAAEATIMAIVIPITIIIVGIISNIIINDSRKMAAMLKALGYSDRKNIGSILALFIPTILIGLAIAVPLTFGITLGYQAIIFNTANILVDVTQQWWYYIVAIAGIGTILGITYGIGLVSLKRGRLVDQIK